MSVQSEYYDSGEMNPQMLGGDSGDGSQKVSSQSMDIDTSSLSMPRGQDGQSLEGSFNDPRFNPENFFQRQHSRLDSWRHISTDSTIGEQSVMSLEEYGQFAGLGKDK